MWKIGNILLLLSLVGLISALMPSNLNLSFDNGSKHKAYQIQSDNRYRRRITTDVNEEHQKNQELTNAFIEKLTTGVLAKNRTIVNDCFEPGFRFKSCKRTDNMFEMVGEMLERTESNFKVMFEASYHQPADYWINIYGKIDGWKGHTYNLFFTINKENLKAVKGEVLRCSPYDP